MADLGTMNVKVGADITGLLSKVDAAKAKLGQLTEENGLLKAELKDLNQSLKNNDSAIGKLNSQISKSTAITKEDRAAVAALRKERDALVASGVKISAAIKTTTADLAINTTQLKAQAVAVKQAENAGNAFVSGATKVYSGLRKLAYIIPGVGIAGLVSLISGPLIDAFSEWIDSVNELSDAQKLLKDNIQNTSDINKAASENIAKQTAALSTLYSIATDVTRSMNARVGAVKELQKEFPNYFKNISQENILNGNAKAAYDALTDSLIANALAKAQLDKITDIGVKKSDIQSQVDDLIAARKRMLDAVKGTKIANPLSTLDNSGFSGVTVSAEQQKNEINNYFEKQLKPLQSQINSFDNQIKNIRKRLNPAALLSGEGGESKTDIKSGVLAAFDAQIKVLEDYKNNIATTAADIASVNAQIKKLQEERAKYDPTNAQKKKVETISDVLKKLAIQIDFLNQKELLLKTDQSQAKINAIEASINELMQKFGLQANNPIVLKLEAQVQDINLKEIFKKDTANRKNEKLEVPVEFKPEPKPDYQAFDTERYKLIQRLKDFGVTKTKIGIPIDTANNKELQDTLDETLLKLKNISDFTVSTLSPAFDALFEGILSGSQNAFQSFGQALQQTIVQLGAAVLKAAAFAAILSAINPDLTFKSAFKNLLGFSSGGSVKGLATGGYIDGPGTKTSDSI